MTDHSPLDLALDHARDHLFRGDLVGVVDDLVDLLNLIIQLEDPYGLPDMRSYFCAKMHRNPRRCSCDTEAEDM